MHKRYLSLGICQLMQGYDIEKNLIRAISQIDEAQARGAEVAVLPEMFLCPYEPHAIKTAIAYTHEAMDKLKACSRRHGIFIIAGSLPFEAGEKRPKNRAIVFDPKGDLIYRHDKIHLFDCSPPGGPHVKESATISPGNSLGTFLTPWGVASVIVCYDIRFTPLIQLLVDQHVRLLFVPAAFTLSTGKAHWEMLLRLRAVEIQGFVVGVQPAFNDELNYVPYGHSIVAGPWGDVLLDAGDKETVEVIRLDMLESENIQKKFPLIAHRRADLYRTVWNGGD